MKKNEYIKLNGVEYLVSLIPSDRRSISFRMISSSEIEVRHPKSMNSKKSFEFINSKSSWIAKKHSIFKAAEEAGLGKGVYEGRMLYVFGEEYSIKLGGNEIKIKDGNLLVPVDSTAEDIEKWYGLMSEKFVKSFSEDKKKLIPPCTIKVKKQKNMWGSCNTKRRIYINRRISMCPEPVIEYVLWHEISHLNHMNHSKSFYRQLLKYCPDYKIHSGWLKKRGLQLNI